MEQMNALGFEAGQYQGSVPSRTMRELALDFLNNIDDRFGKQSEERFKIQNTLISFTRGEISKRQVLSIVSDTIGNHLDLKNQLVDFFKHEDARWGPDDFDVPLLPPPQSAPPFLQPIHQLQMQLPSMSSLWSPIDTSSALGSPMSFSGQEEKALHEHPVRDRAEVPKAESEHWQHSNNAGNACCIGPQPLVDEASVQLASPGVDHELARHSRFVPARRGSSHQPHYEEEKSVQMSAGAHGWCTPDRDNMWADGGLDQVHAHEQALAPKEYSPMAHGATHSTENPLLSYQEENMYRPHEVEDFFRPELPRTLESVAPPSDNPFAMYPHNAVKAPARSRKRSRNTSGAPIKAERQRQDSCLYQAIERDGREVSPTDTGPLRPQLDDDARFIHGLCGKAFSRRSQVKKHHWGGKVNNVHTTTGCWAKHNRPDVAWDDHPSCKEVPRSKTQTKPAKGASLSPEKKAPAVPSMTPSRFASLPHLPVLESDSQHVEDTTHLFQEPPHFTQQVPASFNIHHLSTSSPFQSLLTAVNVASTIEAPVAHGRTQSVVDQLDAQVLAAERAAQYAPVWTLPPHQHADDVEQYQYIRPAHVAYGQDFDTTPVHTHMWMGAPQLHADPGNSYPSSLTSPTEPTFHDPWTAPRRTMLPTTELQPHVLVPHEWESPRASLSPGPESKRRRMI